MPQTNFQKARQLSISSANCLNRISPLAQCSICQQVCPEHALSFQDEQWTAVNCSLCGLCAMTCPTQVFQIDQHRLLQHEKEQPLNLCCTQNSTAPAHALRLNCLQQFSPLMLLYLLYRYPKITIYLTPEQCQQCRHHWYVPGFLQQLEQYQIPAEQLQITTHSFEDPQPAVENQRRELFRDLFHRTEERSKKAVADTVEKITATFSSAETSTSQTEVFPARLPLYALYVKKQLPVYNEAQLPFRMMECMVCNFCGACTHICPTQALTLQEKEAEKQLLFQPELCINCNLCQTVCMQHGLQWDDFMTQQQFLQTPFLLAHSPEKICSQCEHEFYQWPASEASACRFCRHDSL